MKFILELEDGDVAGSHVLEVDEVSRYDDLEKWKDFLYSRNIDDVDVILFETFDLEDFCEFCNDTSCQVVALDEPPEDEYFKDIKYMLVLPD